METLPTVMPRQITLGHDMTAVGRGHGEKKAPEAAAQHVMGDEGSNTEEESRELEDGRHDRGEAREAKAGATEAKAAGQKPGGMATGEQWRRQRQLGDLSWLNYKGARALCRSGGEATLHWSFV